MKRLLIVGGIAALAIALLITGAVFIAGHDHAAAQPSRSPFSTEALVRLDSIPIKGRAPKTGYDRDQFGPSWTDDNGAPGGHNGCKTRDDILARDLVNARVESDCTVLDGELLDPYSGTTVTFHRGRGTSSQVQIDHVVALSNAWQTGAFMWDDAKRLAFANDPANLQATVGHLNQQKSDGDAATWLPPNKSYRCTYVSRQVEVKATYELWMTPAEHDAIFNILANCS